MTHGKFVWTDLSTFDLPTARSDYAELFSWHFTGDDNYDFAFLGEAEVAAIFPMPPKLVEINMPSFWMSYVQVDDLENAVAKAKSHQNVIVEVEPEDFGTDARISLVRDPSGAGFTLYEGPDIEAAQNKAGTVTARYHHLHDVRVIEAFYGDLFGWSFELVNEKPWPVYNISHHDGSVVAQAEEVPETIRGKFSYWMPGFPVRQLEDTITRLESNHGGATAQLTNGRQILSDQQGAHFILQDAIGALA